MLKDVELNRTFSPLARRQWETLGWYDERSLV